MFQKNVVQFPAPQNSSDQTQNNHQSNPNTPRTDSPLRPSPTSTQISIPIPISDQRRLAHISPVQSAITEPIRQPSALFDLISVAAHRGSAFLAEAAVLVLVLALLDRFMLKGHLERNWAIGAFTLSLLLLAASIATDFTSRRFLRRP